MAWRACRVVLYVISVSFSERQPWDLHFLVHVCKQLPWVCMLVKMFWYQNIVCNIARYMLRHLQIRLQCEIIWMTARLHIRNLRIEFHWGKFHADLTETSRHLVIFISSCVDVWFKKEFGCISCSYFDLWSIHTHSKFQWLAFSFYVCARLWPFQTFSGPRSFDSRRSVDNH